MASGAHDLVLASGVEKMTDVDGGAATYALSTAADQEYECFHGITFPGLYAMMARDHMHRYGTTRKQLAEVAVKNHQHGSMNPLAQFLSLQNPQGRIGPGGGGFPHRIVRVGEHVPVVPGLLHVVAVVDRNPVQPGAPGGLEENIVRGVLGLLGVAQHPQRQIINRAAVLGVKVGEWGLPQRVQRGIRTPNGSWHGCSLALAPSRGGLRRLGAPAFCGRLAHDCLH